MRVLLRMPELQDASPAAAGRLLRVLLIRGSQVPLESCATSPIPALLMARVPGRHPRGFTALADWAGVLGATFAALCCAGIPFIVTGLAALGLSFLRRDGILWPLMIASLLVALWGFWRGVQFHARKGPLVLASIASVVLVAGVIFVHGFPAMEMIWSAIAALLTATAWNVFLRRAALSQPRKERVA